MSTGVAGVTNTGYTGNNIIFKAPGAHLQRYSESMKYLDFVMVWVNKVRCFCMSIVARVLIFGMC